MKHKFTVHCINWHAGAALLNDVRVAAHTRGQLVTGENLTDDLDESSRHALALSDDGKVIGCARITPNWFIDRIVVLPLEGQGLIKAALVEMLGDYAFQMGVDVNNSLDYLNLHSYPTLLAA